MDKQRRLQKFSIRKYTVGACSILVGTLIFLSSPTHHAFASENTVDATKLEVTEKEKENEVTKAEKEVEEAVNTTEVTSTNQSATDESTEQSKFEEIGKQQVEQEKVGSIAESSKPEESINKLEVKNEIDNKQEAPVKQDTVEEMEIPKVDEASQPATVTPEVKENKNHNDAVKSEVKTVAKENEQVQKEVVPPEIKEVSQTEKKTTESEQKLDKTETPNKTAVAVKQPREERSIRTRRELRSADDSAPRENVNNDTSSDNFVITGKAFGKKANDQEVSDYAHIAHSYVKENGDNVEFHYVIHFNKAESNKARGRFYVYAPSFVKLTPGSIQRVTGSGTFNNWKNKALVTGGSKLNSMVYQAMIPVDRDYYKNLTKITDEDNFYYIHEELNYRRNSYIAKMTATVSKDILRKNNGKFYVAIGVATENIARANRTNHVNFIENRANVSDADKFNPKGKEQTVELNEIPNAEQSINTYGLPNGTKYVYTSPIDTSTIGNKNTTVRVSYPDGTHDDVPVVLVVNDTVAPVGPTIENQSIEKDKAIDPITIPNATDNSGEIKPTSVTGLPTGLNYNNQTNQITGTPTVEGTNDVTVTYTDTSGNTVTKVFQLNITDTTPPAKPVIQTDLTGKGGTTEPITVQSEPGSKVELFDKDGNKIGESETDSNGIATITPTKPLPEGNITAKATDKAENPNTSEASEPIKVTDTTPPTKPVIQTDLTGKGGEIEPITVQAEPGSKVELFDKDGNKIGKGETDGNGIATITPTKPLPEGNITAKATDKAENPNTSEASEPIKVTDTTAPSKPVIQTNLTGKGGTTEPITVQAEPGSKVELFDKDGKKIGEGTADDQGNAVIIATKPLPEGNVTAKATDKAETPNTSDASEPIKVTDTTPPAKPVIQTDLTGKGGTTDPITVQAEPGSKVELFDKDGNKIGEGETDSNGVAMITPIKPLSEGNITAKATDKAETPNTSEASEPIKVTDTTPPTKPVIQTDLTGKGGTTDPITVQAEPGSKVDLFDKDGNKIGEAITDNQGNAVITPTKPLPEGNVTAKATDKAENPNTSEASEPIKVTDTTAPAKPVIQTDLNGKGGTTEPITVQAEPGSKVELFDKDGNKIGESETDGDGVATITPTKPLPEGNITAKATDKAENPNTSEASEPIKVTDTTAPSKPVIQTNLTGKGGTTEPITVQSEPGSKVELFDKDGNKIGESETDSNGIATITPTKPLPEGNVTAKATDKAETPNMSEASEPIKVTDTTPPAKPVIQTDLTGKGGTTEPITVQAEPGSKVELFDKDGNKIGEGETDSNGIATITPTRPLPEGNVTAKATDKAENPNTSEASDSMKVTDTTPPAKPVIETDLIGKGGTTEPITVQSEPGSKVELFDIDGNKIGEGETDGDGVATITPTKPLPEGNVTAKATDKAENPNTSEASDSIMVTNPKDTDDTTDNQDSDINGDDKNNKDESNPSASTPTNNDGDVQPDATTPLQNPSNNGVDEKPGNNNGSDQPNTGGNEQTNNGDGVNNKDEEVASTDSTNSDSNGNGISDGGEDADKEGNNQSKVTTPAKDSNNNGENENPGNNNGSDQPNTGGIEQYKDTDSDGINNKDEETEATDSTESNSNDNGISNGDEDSDKDGISNKEESDSNSTIPTDKDVNGQSDVTKPSQDSNNNGSNQTNTGNNNLNNTDQHNDTNSDNTPNNQDSDNEGNGVNNKDEDVTSTDPTNSDSNGNGISDGGEDADKDGNNQYKDTTPAKDSNNNGENENPGNNIGSDQPNTGGIEQYKDTDGDGINNKDEETEATDPTESNSNDCGISNGDEDSDKDGISNKDESDSNSTIPTDKDVNGQSNTGNNNPNNTDQYKDTNNDNTPNNQDSDIEGNSVNNKNESNPNASTPTNNNDSGQSNTGDDNPNNADQSKDTDDEVTPDNQDTDIDGDGINNINKEISGTNPMNSDTKENGALSDEEKSVDSKGSIQPNIDENVMKNNNNISNNGYDKLNSNNDIIKLAAKDDISSEGNGVTNINYELNNVSSISQQNSNTNLNDQNATNDMSNNDQSSEAHSNIDHEDAKVLPDTGEEESKLAGLLGITSLFGGLTLLFRRKKSEDKE
ncbi:MULTISPECIES: Rib/alpha-like domain-containing protein [unclassified Mammaliicoccus]|uniref:Rib/alpha-like domain-containing protein n=1 Tax=unclassified Mammaliicoccus TaxID=2803851 RepID=UPI001EFA63D6|nr:MULTISPECIES: Rib/alpha-like domain-containing protein [unclassified Mammaliicoccus]